MSLACNIILFWYDNDLDRWAGFSVTSVSSDMSDKFLKCLIQSDHPIRPLKINYMFYLNFFWKSYARMRKKTTQTLKKSTNFLQYFLVLLPKSLFTGQGTGQNMNVPDRNICAAPKGPVQGGFNTWE